MAESKTSGRHLKTAERRRVAVLRRIGGDTYEQIGELLGVSRQAAYKLVKGALEELKTDTALNAEELRTLELERLEFMRRAIWAGVVKGDVQAVDRALKISKRLSELTGIDAPLKSEIAGIDKIVVTIKDEQDDGD